MLSTPPDFHLVGAGRFTCRSRPGAQAAFTVLEAAVASAIMLVFFVSLFALVADMLHLLRASAEAASASQDLQQRVEAVRMANWPQITDPNWIQANLLAVMTDASVNLPGLTETLTVSPYTSPSSTPPSAYTPPFTVTRNADGTVTISPPGYAFAAVLAEQEMVQIDLGVMWPGLYRPRTRGLTTLISKWGISK